MHVQRAAACYDRWRRSLEAQTRGKERSRRVLSNRGLENSPVNSPSFRKQSTDLHKLNRY